MSMQTDEISFDGRVMDDDDANATVIAQLLTGDESGTFCSVFSENGLKKHNKNMNESRESHKPLFDYADELAFKDGCEARCISCHQGASYNNRVLNESRTRYLSIPGTAPDAFFFFLLALLLGCLFAANWRWIGPRTRRYTKFLSFIPHTITILIAGMVMYALAYEFNLNFFSNSFAWWININPPELLFYALLPVLLFDAAMRVNWFYFRQAFVSIMIFAFVVVILNSILMVR